MADVLIYNTSTGAVVGYERSVNTPDYEGRADVLINPTLVEGVPLKYLKVQGGSVVEMSQAEKDAVDAAVLAQEQAAFIQSLKDALDASTVDAARWRMLVLAMVNQLNVLRTHPAIGLAPITKQQVRTFMRNLADSGDTSIQ